jgi:PAS domain S-box-containing protein
MLQESWNDLPDAAVVTDAAGAVSSWNLAAEELFGYPASEATGRQLQDLVFVPEPAPADTGVPAAESHGNADVYEAIRRRRDGSLIYCSIAARRAGPDGSDRLLLIRNVTGLKVAREARLLRARFGNLLESVPDATLVINGLGRIVLANSQAERTFGYADGGLVGVPVESLLPARYQRGHVAHRAAYVAAPRTRAMGRDLELLGRRSSGEEFPVEVSLSPIETDEGVMVMSAVRDMTQRKKAEQKFRSLLEAAPDAMVIVDRAGRIALVNTQAERLFGYGRDALLGQSVDLLVPERFRGRHGHHRGGFFEEPHARPMGEGLQLFGQRSDGTEFPVEISLSPLDTEDGLYVSSAIRDATERRRIERNLHEANRLKSEFLANMSHELRTPLNGIIGFSELLLDGKAGPVSALQKDFLLDVLNSGQHLLRLINGVLDLSKIEAGRLEIVPETFALLPAINEVLAVIDPLAAKKGLVVGRRLVDALVIADRQKFVQVLYNLLSNAVKFTDVGRVDLTVTHGTHGTHGTNVPQAVHGRAGPPGAPAMQDLKVTVADTGIGIREEDLSRLFREFTQLDSGAGRRFEGTGLGLALTRRLVEAQGGEIAVESRLGAGTTFTVRLPVGVPQAREVALAASRHPG